MKGPNLFHKILAHRAIARGEAGDTMLNKAADRGERRRAEQKRADYLQQRFAAVFHVRNNPFRFTGLTSHRAVKRITETG